MSEVDDERRPWPPAHNEAELKATIERVAARVSENLWKQFYLTRFADPEPCQGDVLALTAGVPIIDRDGDVAEDEIVDHWLVLANSCDVQRTFDSDDVEHVSLVPIFPVEDLEGFEIVEFAVAARSYQLSRLFFLPSWDEASGAHIVWCSPSRG